MIEASLLFVVGLIVLLAGAEGLVRGASSIATRSNISPLVIGLTVVAFGTSMPELVVVITSIFDQSTDIGIGNIVGSNIANILIALGLAAMVGTLTVSQSTYRKEIPFLIVASIVLLVTSFDTVLGRGANTIDRFDGVLLLVLFTLFMGYIYTLSKRPEPIATKLFQLFRFTPKTYSYLISISMTMAGLVGLVVGATLTVDGAETLARAAGLSELVIGLTVVAVGTSLPELATTLVAVYRRKSDLAIGNIVGSNLFNILWVIGVASVVSPVAISEALLLNIAIAAIAPIVLLVALTAGKMRLNRVGGLLLLALYLAYVAYVVVGS